MYSIHPSVSKGIDGTDYLSTSLCLQSSALGSSASCCSPLSPSRGSVEIKRERERERNRRYAEEDDAHLLERGRGEGWPRVGTLRLLLQALLLSRPHLRSALSLSLTLDRSIDRSNWFSISVVCWFRLLLLPS